MGDTNIVGCGIVSHVPTIMLPQAVRLELNDGKEISFIDGFRRLKQDVMVARQPQAVVVFDTHWFSTIEFIVTGHSRRQGVYTSEELPRGMFDLPYDLPGQPELARSIAEHGARVIPFIANDNPHMPIHYPTLNIAHYLQTAQEAWLSVSIPQTATHEDFMVAGKAIGEGLRASGLERIVMMASGGLSHRFWPLRELSAHEASDPVHVFTPAARAADEERIRWMEQGAHARIIDSMPDYAEHRPEGKFGHYLMMAAAMGGRDWHAKGVRYSDYENATGTGQVHLWFDTKQ